MFDLDKFDTELISLFKYYYNEPHRDRYNWSYIVAGTVFANGMGMNLNAAQKMAWLSHKLVDLNNSQSDYKDSTTLLYRILDKMPRYDRYANDIAHLISNMNEGAPSPNFQVHQLRDMSRAYLLDPNSIVMYLHKDNTEYDRLKNVLDTDAFLSMEGRVYEWLALDNIETVLKEYEEC